MIFTLFIGKNEGRFEATAGVRWRFWNVNQKKRPPIQET